MKDFMTRVIRTEDHPELDPGTDEGKEGLSLIALQMNLNDPTACHFLFERSGQVVGEMYLANDGSEESN